MTFTLQATHFSITGEKVDVGGQLWPLFRATIFNDDDSVLDSREGYDDLSLCQWVESFDFNVLTKPRSEAEIFADIDCTALCECGHYADQHNDEQPHECLELTLGRRARCSCHSWKEA